MFASAMDFEQEASDGHDRVSAASTVVQTTSFCTSSSSCLLVDEHNQLLLLPANLHRSHASMPSARYYTLAWELHVGLQLRMCECSGLTSGCAHLCPTGVIVGSRPPERWALVNHALLEVFCVHCNWRRRPVSEAKTLPYSSLTTVIASHAIDAMSGTAVLALLVSCLPALAAAGMRMSMLVQNRHDLVMTQQQNIPSKSWLQARPWQAHRPPLGQANMCRTLFAWSMAWL
jgi:hypothetical protein